MLDRFRGNSKFINRICMSKIIVVGSSNTDMVVHTSHLPVPGETILGGKFLMNQGGKGANQAVAVKRLGGDLLFVAKLGDDIWDSRPLRVFQNEGIATNYIALDKETPSGVALISVDQHAENCIVVASGANMSLGQGDIDSMEKEMLTGDVLLMQLEIPLPTVEYAAQKAYEKGVKVVLNPAPACSLPESLFQHLYMITPNRIEAEMLTGVKINSKKDVAVAADVLYRKGVKNIIITLGGEGSFVREGEKTCYIDACKVVPVDTTAAGDTFNGAVCVGVSEGMSLEQAVLFASKASSISVTRMGAQSSIPYRKELDINNLV